MINDGDATTENRNISAKASDAEAELHPSHTPPSANPATGNAAQDIILFGKRGKAPRDNVPVTSMSLVLGAPEDYKHGELDAFKSRLAALGYDPANMHPSIQMIQTAEDQPAEPRVTLSIAARNAKGLPEPIAGHGELLAKLSSAGLITKDAAEAASQSMQATHRTMGERIREDGFLPTMKHIYQTAPLRIVGVFYGMGDALGLISGGINSFGLVESRGYGDLAFGAACSSSSIIMTKWGSPSTLQSDTERFMQGLDKHLAKQHFHSTPEAPRTASEALSPTEAANQFLDTNASRIAKSINATAPLGLVKAGIEQGNPTKILQGFFAGIGFPIAMMMPKEGVDFDETGIGKRLRGQNDEPNGLFKASEAAFNFMQKRPNSLIGLSIFHNILGFRSAWKDIVRSPKNRAALEAEYDAPPFHPYQDVRIENGEMIYEPVRDKEGNPKQWHQMSTRELKPHLARQKDGWVARVCTNPEEPDMTKRHYELRALSSQERINVDAALRRRTPNTNEHFLLEKATEPSEWLGESNHPNRLMGADGTEYIRTMSPERARTFETNVADYQMYGRLRISAIPYAMMVSSYFIGNTLYGFSVEKKTRIEPTELFSQAAQRLLDSVKLHGDPITALTQSAGTLHTMVEWLAKQPEVRYAAKNGEFDIPEGMELHEAIAQHIHAAAETLAPLTRQEDEFARWQQVANEITGTALQSNTPQADQHLVPNPAREADQQLHGTANQAGRSPSAAAAEATLLGSDTGVTPPAADTHLTPEALPTHKAI